MNKHLTIENLLTFGLLKLMLKLQDKKCQDRNTHCHHEVLLSDFSDQWLDLVVVFRKSHINIK